MKKTCESKIWKVTLDCTDVATCVNTELTKVIVGQTTYLTDFCDAVSACVDAEFENIANGASTNFDHFGPAYNKLVESFSGYSTSGDLYFTSVDGVIEWTTVVAGTTIVTAGTGIIVSGAGITGNPYVVASSITQYTDENAQDAVGTILSAEFTYDDATPAISINSIALTKITTPIAGILSGNGTAVVTTTVSSPLSYSGTTLSLGTVGIANGGTNLVALGSALEVLRVNALGTALEYFTPSYIAGNETITLSGDASGSGTTAITVTLASNSVSDAKLRDSAAYSVIGRASGTTGDPTDIVAAADTVLTRSGSGNVAFQKIVTANIDDGQVTFAKLQDASANGAIIGRFSGGAGDFEELTITGGSLDNTGGVLQLLNDSLTPGVSKFYGTDSSGSKGWQPLNRTLIAVNKYSTSSTWTAPAGCNAFLVEVWGGGGGGGAAAANTAQCAAAGGGGAGGYYRAFVTSSIPGSAAVTIGAGGNGSSDTSVLGTTGGGSTFGSYGTANGGTGGAGMVTGTSVAIAAGGQGGTISSLTASALFSANGNCGTGGIRVSGSSYLTGMGAAGGFGGSTHSAVAGNGFNGSAPGAGGGGASQEGTTDVANGGNGHAGLIIVYSYS